jgi:hypothetical protein
MSSLGEAINSVHTGMLLKVSAGELHHSIYALEEFHPLWRMDYSQENQRQRTLTRLLQ